VSAVEKFPINGVWIMTIVMIVLGAGSANPATLDWEN